MNQSTEHLLVILNEVALVAELEPAKQSGFYNLQSLRQINGSFIEAKNELNAANLTKLFNKIDPQSFHLILPDKLFFDEIFSVPSTDDEEIKDYINNEILPHQPISFDTHQIQTSFLLQLKESCRIQISAASLKMLEQVGQCVAESSVQITDIIPFSWLAKSLVTMEPSLSIIEAGNKIHFAQHYIGLFNTAELELDDTEELIKKIKKSQKEEPNLQIAYLLTENATETSLKKNLKNLLPLQQLASNTSDDGIAPALKAYLENGIRSLEIEEFATPKYEPIIDGSESLEDAAGVGATAAVLADELSTDNEEIIETLDGDEEELIEENLEEGNETLEDELTEEENLLEENESLDGGNENLDEENSSESLDDDEIEVEQKVEKIHVDKDGEVDYEATTTKISASIDELGDDEDDTNEGESLDEQEIVVPHPNDGREPSNITHAGANQSTIITRHKNDDDMEVDSAQLARSQAKVPDLTEDDIQPSQASKKAVAASRLQSAEKSPIIKRASAPEAEVDDYDDDEEYDVPQRNSSSAAQRSQAKPKVREKETSMGKKVLIFIGIFVLTVGAGLGLGFGLLNILDNQVEPTPTPEPVVEVTPEPTPVEDASASAEAEEEIDRAEQKIMVVNATSTAGLAGKIKAKLESAGYKDVATGNAVDSYEDEDNNLAVSNKGNKALLKDLKEASGLNLTSDDEHAAKENPNDKYDMVIVINDPEV